jgi:hypothetical protein
MQVDLPVFRTKEQEQILSLINFWESFFHLDTTTDPRFEATIEHRSGDPDPKHRTLVRKPDWFHPLRKWYCGVLISTPQYLFAFIFSLLLYYRYLTIFLHDLFSLQRFLVLDWGGGDMFQYISGLFLPFSLIFYLHFLFILYAAFHASLPRE